MRGLADAMAAIEIVALRALLPRWFARQPLDVLLARLSTPKVPGASVELGRLSRVVVRTEGLIERATELPGTCLYRALSRYAVLRSAGHAPTFLMGLPRSDCGEPGHAWIEVEGAAFAEHEDVSRFQVTFRYPPLRNGGTVGAG